MTSPLQQPRRRVLDWCQRLLFLVGIIALGYCGMVFTDLSVCQVSQSRALQKQLQRATLALGRFATGEPGNSDTGHPAGGDACLVGRMEVSRIGISSVILEGVGEAVLRRAIGHIPGTALPGQGGNVGLAGHRDMFFRPLRNIRKDDEITVTTTRGVYRYRVEWTKVVGPDDVWVLNPGTESLTLVTCYPFQFVGSAPNRFIVRARGEFPARLPESHTSTQRNRSEKKGT